MEKTAYNLSKIDSYFQEHNERALDRSGVPDLYSGHDGWKGVQQNNPDDFELAWAKAQVLMLEQGVTEEQIQNF